MTKHINSIFNIYSKLHKAAELQVKLHNPNLNLSKYIVTKKSSDNEIINTINQIIPFIKNPEYSYLYLKKSKKN